MQRNLCLLAGFFAFVLAMPAAAGTLTFSDLVSIQPAGCGTGGNDPCVEAAWLDATLDFTIDNDANEVTILLTNLTGNGDPTFDINRLYFSVSSSVTGLSLDSATHSVEGDVLSGWGLNASTGDGGDTHGDGFGVHDFSLFDGVGNGTDMAGPGENISFVLSFTSTGDLTMSDFLQLSEQTEGGTNILGLGTLKFVNGAPGLGGNDSGFGVALIPEPATGALVGLGLLGLGWAGRRR